jgi:hypothetical protein
VYFNDWYDQQHCHNPNNERWERGSGRVYRLQWDATYRPVRVDLAALPDERLVRAPRPPNDWYPRTARRLLQERARAGRSPPKSPPALGRLFASTSIPAIRLRALWSLHAVGHFGDSVSERALNDPDEYVRGWAIQLAAEDRQLSAAQPRLSCVWPGRPVPGGPTPPGLRAAPAAGRRGLAVDRTARTHGEDREDRNLPYLLWHGLAPRLATDLDRALALADTTPLPSWPTGSTGTPPPSKARP